LEHQPRLLAHALALLDGDCDRMLSQTCHILVTS